MKTVILASASSRRRALLEKTGLRITVLPSKVSESIKPYLSPAHHVIHLALAKAETIAKKADNSLVVGADTIVAFGNKIFGKPKNTRDAKFILTTLNQTKHDVYTGIAVIDTKTKRRIVDVDKTTVFTRKLTTRQIRNLASQNLDKAGAYAVQKKADLLVRKFEGDYYNLVGLPLSKLINILQIFGIKTNSRKKIG